GDAIGLFHPKLTRVFDLGASFSERSNPREKRNLVDGAQREPAFDRHAPQPAARGAHADPLHRLARDLTERLALEDGAHLLDRLGAQIVVSPSAHSPARISAVLSWALATAKRCAVPRRFPPFTVIGGKIFPPSRRPSIAAPIASSG